MTRKPEYLQVRNWEKYQHYKTGKNAEARPPWIKLHRSVMRDYEFGCLSMAEKGQLLLIWLLAAETENRIPNDSNWIGRQIDSDEDVDLDRFISLRFLEAYGDPRTESPEEATSPSKVLGQIEKNIEQEKEVEREKPLVGVAADRSTVEALHAYFNKVRGGKPLLLTTARRAKYRARLKTHSAETLMRAIDAALADPFYRGDNDRQTRYDFPETVLKSDEAVERHLARTEPRPAKPEHEAIVARMEERRREREQGVAPPPEIRELIGTLNAERV